MKKTNITKDGFTKQPYVAPQMTVIEVERHTFLCASLTPSQGGSAEGGFDDKGGHDGGRISFGDETTVAPAKGGWSWEDED